MRRLSKVLLDIVILTVMAFICVGLAACGGHDGKVNGQAVLGTGQNNDGGNSVKNNAGPTAAVTDLPAVGGSPTASSTSPAGADNPTDEATENEPGYVNNVFDHKVKDENGVTHLEFYELFDSYNGNWDYFKDFVLSEEWIDGDLYYQLLCDEKDVRIVIDKTQENAVIYHDGKQMEYQIRYIITGMASYATVELLDITGDGKDDLIVCHGEGGTGVFEGSCDVIDLDNMTEYMIDDYIYNLSTRIVVEPLEITQENYLICRITDEDGHVYYGKADAIYENLSDYSYQPGSYNSYCIISVDNDDKCLAVSTGISLDEPYNGCYLGNVGSHMIFNPDTQTFELSDEYSVDIDEVYYDGLELPSELKQMCMKDEKLGWALTEDGIMLKTTDGWGSYTQAAEFNWNKETINVSTVTYVKDILFVSGFIATEESIIIFRSDDGGNTWSSGLCDYSAFDEGAGQAFLSFSDSRHGYLLYCGEPALGLMVKVLYTTSDGGKTFAQVSDLSGVISGYPSGLSFTEDGRGFITSTYHGKDYSYLYTTEDDGSTWKPVILPVPEQYIETTPYSYIDGYPPKFWGNEGIMFMEYVLKGTGESSFFSYRTADGGLSWKPDAGLKIPFLSAFDFTDRKQAFLIDNIGEIIKIKKGKDGWKPN